LREQTLAFSIGAHAFPSTGDGKSLWNATIESLKKKRFWNAVFLPFVALIYIGALLSFFWIDFIYAGVLVFGTQSVVAGEISLFSEIGISGYFENNVVSFNYPLGFGVQRPGNEIYESLKIGLQPSEVYFIGANNDTLIIATAANQIEGTDIELVGEVEAMLQESDESVEVREKGLKTFNEGQWYQINSIISDVEGTLYRVSGMTYCGNKRVSLQVLGERHETELFESMAKSFYCRKQP